jgi:PadR family transcriptional regulator PadR
MIFGMPSQESLGELEHLVLLAVLRLGPAACGAPVIEDIEKRTRRRISRGAVYITLRRLERKGFLKSHLGDPSPERGGRAKRFFQVERHAIRLLRESRKGLLEMWRGLDTELR